MKLPDELKHPSGGEHVDELAHNVLSLAHEALDRFPEVKRRNMFLAGGAAVSSALVIAAGVAIMKRVRAGQRPEDAVQDVTEEELEGLRLVEREHYRPPAAEDETTEGGEGSTKPATGTD
ncbi:MAG: hypothetical protein CVU47_07135 [Chloroflexi bacterium HGW-Chloroflexi-9]|nr:MAG: hypothetical protein CVU47_07135 [Chloroflexi bacterium HGW-Chloroflexi-9]